jgi:membrane-associated PAP2 superfamily phosphatase
MPLQPFQRWVFWTLSTLVGVMFWDALRLDIPMALWFGSLQGFPLQDHWFLSTVLHDRARDAGWFLLLLLVLAIRWPFGVLRHLSRGERGRLVLGIVLALVVVSLIKQSSLSSCPWDLQEFGGPAQYVSHWSWGVADGGGGHCFPAGHASTGFAFLAAYLALQDKAPRQARLWLALALLAGFGLGLVQQIRGAHYMSHVLWTAWFCWASVGISHFMFQYARRNQTVSEPIWEQG